MKDTIIETIFKYVIFILGTFLLALSYNLLLAPNNLVVGGMSGLGLVLSETLGWNSEVFIYASSFILLIIGYVFLGIEESNKAFFGSILYPLMVSFTMPLANFFLKYSDVSEVLIIVSLAGLLYGSANGLIYKMGFNTGGGDIIMKLMSKYSNFSDSEASIAYNIIILILSGFVFGLSSFIYSIIIMAISTLIINKIDLGNSNGKVIMVYTNKAGSVKRYLKDNNKSIFNISKNKNTWVLCVIVTEKEYTKVKDAILRLDDNAIVVVNNSFSNVKRITDII